MARALLVSLLAGCATYHTERSAMVPVVAPNVAPGDERPRTGAAIGYTTPGTDPKLAGGSGAGLYVPRHTFGIEPTVAVGEHFEIRSAFEGSLYADAIPLRQTDVPPARSPWGFGGGVAGHYDASDGLFYVLSAELLLFDISSRVRVTCDPPDPDPYGSLQFGQTCADDGDSIEHSTIPVLRAFSSLGMQSRRGYGYVLLGMRNQPSNDGSDTTVGEPNRDAEVTVGSLYATVGAGGGLRLFEWFALVAQVTAPLGYGAVQYGPLFTVGASAYVPK
jgi:hypothetical protein